MVNWQLEYQVSSHPCANPSASRKSPGPRQYQSSWLHSSLTHGLKAANSRNSQQQGIVQLTVCEFGITQAIWDTRAYAAS